MLGRSPLFLLFAAVLVSLAPSILATHGDPDSTDNANPRTWIVDDYTLRFADNLTSITLEARVGVHKITDAGNTVTADDLRSGYLAAPADGRDAYLAPFRADLKDMMDATLAAMFPGSATEYLALPTEDPATLSGGATGPVAFASAVRVDLDGAGQGLGSYDESQIGAVFKAGAEVRLAQAFSASPGHASTFTLVPPSFAEFVAASGPGAVSDGKVVLTFDAADRSDAEGPAIAGPVTLTLRDPAQTPPAAEDVLIRTRVYMHEFEKYPNGTYVPGMPMTFEILTDLAALDWHARMPGLQTPAAVTIPDFLSSDAVRILYQNGIVTDAHLQEAEATIMDQVKGDLDASFRANTTVVVTQHLDATGPVSSPLDGAPVLRFASRTLENVYYDIGADSNTADAGLAAGAVVDFNITVTEQPGLKQRYNFTLPPDLAYMDDEHPRRGAYRAHEVNHVTHRLLISFLIGDPTIRRATVEDISNEIRVALPDLQGLQDPTVPLTIDATVGIRSMNVTSRFPTSLPPNVRLRFMTAEGMRILVNRGVISSADLAKATSDLVSELNRTLAGAFPAGVSTAGDFRAGTFAYPEGAAPIVFLSHAVARHDIGTTGDKADGALRAGAIVNTTLPLTAPAHQNATYTVALPPDTYFFTGATRGAATLQTTIVNAAGAADLKQATPARFGRDMARPAREDVRLTIEVALQPFRDDVAGVPTNATVTADLHVMDVGTRFPTSLPSNVELPFLTADGFRILHARGLITDADLDNASADITGTVTERLKSMGSGIHATTAFDRASLTSAAGTPARIRSDVTLVKDLGGATAAEAQAGLDAGAIVNQTFSLSGEKGQLTRYVITLAPGLRYFTGTTPGDTSQETVLDNRLGAAEMKREVSLRFGKDMPRPTRADVQVDIDLTIERFRNDVQGIPVHADITTDLAAMDLHERFPDALPANVDLRYLTGDGFRILYARGLIKESDLDNATRKFREDIEGKLKGAFGGNATVVAAFDRASLTSAAGTPVRLTATATMAKSLGSATPAQAEIIFQSGAVVALRLDLSGLKHTDVTYTIHLPETLAFSNVTGAASLDQRTVKARLDGRDAAADLRTPFAARLYDPLARSFTEQHASIDITIDMKLDLSLIEAARTQNGDLQLDIDAVVSLGVVELPSDIRARLPADVEITHLPVDALRRLWQVGALNESQVSKLEHEFLDKVAKGLEGIAGRPVVVTGGLSRPELDKPVAGALSGDDPVHLTATAPIHKPLRGATQPQASGQALISLYQIPMNLPLQSFQGLPTTYKVILPKGLAFAKADGGSDATVTTGETEDGRSYLVATVTGGKTATAAMAIAVTPALVVDQFLPWLIGGGVVLVILIALPIVGIVKLVRRRRRKA